MDEEKSINEQLKENEEALSNSIKVIREEYERKLNDMKEKYETQISQINTNHIEEIREIMRTGTSPEAQQIQQEDDRYEDEIIIEHLKNKYKI